MSCLFQCLVGDISHIFSFLNFTSLLIHTGFQALESLKSLLVPCQISQDFPEQRVKQDSPSFLHFLCDTLLRILQPWAMGSGVCRYRHFQTKQGVRSKRQRETAQCRLSAHPVSEKKRKGGSTSQDLIIQLEHPCNVKEPGSNHSSG